MPVDVVYDLTDADFYVITEADLAVLRLCADLPIDDFDYSNLWGDEA